MKIEKEKRKGKDKKDMKKLLNYENFIAGIFAMLLISAVIFPLLVPSLLVIFDVFLIMIVVIVIIIDMSES